MCSHVKWINGLLIALLFAGCELQDEVLPQADSNNAAPIESLSPYAAPAPQYAAVPQSAPAAVGRTAGSAQAGKHTGNISFIRGYEAGMKHAATAQLPVMVFFTAEWCYYCHQMADDAFTNPQVVGLSERFVCVMVDADAEPEVCRRFRVQGYPTVQFLTPTGAPLNRLIGKKPSHQVMMAMQAALQNLAQRAQTDGRALR